MGLILVVYLILILMLVIISFTSAIKKGIKFREFNLKRFWLILSTNTINQYRGIELFIFGLFGIGTFIFLVDNAGWFKNFTWK